MKQKMPKIFSATSLTMALMLALLFSCNKKSEPPAKKSGNTEAPRRIVSLSPSTTEILYALNLDDRVVGVTDFCNYPPEAKQKTRLGGFLDPNFEAIASLKPDMVFILPEQQNVRNFLKEMKIPFRIVNNKTVADILGAIKIIGNVCHVRKQAMALVDSLAGRIEKIRKLTQEKNRPKVLVSIGRSIGNGTLADVYAAGENTYYSELIRIAGGQNALQNKSVAYPLLSGEGLVKLNPDIIVDIIFGAAEDSLAAEAAKKDWQQLPQIKAVRENQIFMINASYAVIPGPRFILLLDKLAQIIHPEIDWENHEKTTN